MTPSAAVGRPKIEGLKSLNVRLLEPRIEALDRVVTALQAKRGDPGFNRTDAIREAVDAFIEANDPKPRRAK